MKIKSIMAGLLCFLLVGCNSAVTPNTDAPLTSVNTSSEHSETELFEEDSPHIVPVAKESSSTTVNPNVIKLVIPEGYTLARVGMRLESLGVCTAKEFLVAAQSGDFTEFPLIAEQTKNPNRCFSLEGYIFPDTYEIYKNETPDAIIRRILRHTEAKITPELRQAIKKTGHTVDEILVLASIIEKEAYERNDKPVPQEMPRISSVLQNRLNANMKLQCNVTATYVRGVLKEFIRNGSERYNEYYNTYHCPALPAGAICNPGMDAIKAAIYPADTSYLFFLTDSDKNFYYSEDYAEHLALVEKYDVKPG